MQNDTKTDNNTENKKGFCVVYLVQNLYVL